MAAFSLLDTMFALGLAATLGSMAVPQAGASLERVRARAAARYVATRLQQTRMEAITRGTSTAIRFVAGAGGYNLTSYIDGNRNGVLSRDILSGVDRAWGAVETLRDRFSGVEFGARTALPPVDPTGTPPGTDPIRLGSSDMVVFTPAGTATPGSLYLLGSQQIQYAVRVFGETGKTKVLEFEARSGQWKPL